MVKKISGRTQAISYVAMFSALLVVANFVYVPFGAMAISFVPTIAFLAGVLVNPWVALASGFIGDTMACMLNGYPPAPLILLGTASWGFVCGMVFKYLSGDWKKRLIVGGFLAYIVSSVVLTTVGLYFLIASGSNFWAFAFTRMPIQFANFVINLTMTIVVVKSIGKNKLKSVKERVV